VPEYIARLPRDSRNNNSKNDQYFYWSDGKDYKLIRHAAEDCDLVRAAHPEMIDILRTSQKGCWAYGFWTANGSKW
jgi:hypothetical protein